MSAFPESKAWCQARSTLILLPAKSLYSWQMGNDWPAPASPAPLVVRAPGVTRTLPAGPSYTIGRDPASDIVINDVRVSWQHAILKVHGGFWVLEDTGSTNGTYFGHERVTSIKLGRDFNIRLGSPVEGPVLALSAGTHAQLPVVPVVAASLAPDASLALTVARDGAVRTWYRGTVVSAGQVPAHIGVGAPVAAALSSGVITVVWVVERVVSAVWVEGPLRLFEDPDTLIGPRNLPPVPAPIRALALSPSGDIAVLACDDGTLRGLNVRTQEFRWTLTTGTSVEAVAMASDGGPVVAAFADGTIRRYDLGADTSDIVGASPVPVDALAVTPDGEVVVAAGGLTSLLRWDPRRGAPPQQSEFSTPMITAVAVDGTGEKVLIGTDNGGLRIHDFTGAPGLEYIAPARLAPARPAPADVPAVPHVPAAAAPEPFAPAAVVDDDVGFTVYRPPVVSPGQWASMLVFVHKTTPVVEPGREPVDPHEQVKARAQAHFSGPPPSPVGEDAAHPITRGARLRIVPDLPGIVCNPKGAELEWWEPVHEVPFRLRAGPELAGTAVRGAVRVWCGLLILGEVSITIRVAANVFADPPPQVADFARLHRKIFPSYSHRDSAVVANFAAFARAQGDEYLQDVLTLRAGERWRPRLLRLIEEADVFQLFWSRNSMHSPHCREEWEHALALQRPQFVLPVYWEEPRPKDPAKGLPPQALAALHFVKWPGAGLETVPRPAAARGADPNSPDAPPLRSLRHPEPFPGWPYEPPATAPRRPKPKAPDPRPPTPEAPPPSPPRPAAPPPRPSHGRAERPVSPPTSAAPRTSRRRVWRSPWVLGALITALLVLAAILAVQIAGH
jgi:hypothetical protein